MFPWLLSIVKMWWWIMSMPFEQTISRHQYLCDDVYRCHCFWRASSSKFIHVLAVLQPTAVPFVWCYYVPSAKCIRVCCWRAPTLDSGSLPLSTHNIDMQYLTHPFTDSSGSVPNCNAHAPFFLRHPFSFVMLLINLVDLITLPFFVCFSHWFRCPVPFCRLRWCCHQYPLYLWLLCSDASSH